jgi:hypothetical protein
MVTCGLENSILPKPPDEYWFKEMIPEDSDYWEDVDSVVNLGNMISEEFEFNMYFLTNRHDKRADERCIYKYCNPLALIDGYILSKNLIKEIVQVRLD